MNEFMHLKEKKIDYLHPNVHYLFFLCGSFVLLLHIHFSSSTIQEIKISSNYILHRLEGINLSCFFFSLLAFMLCLRRKLFFRAVFFFLVVSCRFETKFSFQQMKMIDALDVRLLFQVDVVAHFDDCLGDSTDWALISGVCWYFKILQRGNDIFFSSNREASRFY